MDNIWRVRLEDHIFREFINLKLMDDRDVSSFAGDSQLQTYGSKRDSTAQEMTYRG